MKTITLNRIRIAILALSLLICAAISSTVWAAGYPVIGTDELKSLFDKKQKFFLIDARTKQEYANAHIVRSVNIPDKKLQEHVALLPADKNTLLIIYCNGVKCGKSKRLADQLAPRGYGNIKIYAEGIPVWEERNLPLFVGPDYDRKVDPKKLKPAELNAMIQAKRTDYVLVDVRDAAEFRSGHIPTAINIPSEVFSARSGILPKEKKIIVYCNTGSRSYLAYRKLIQLSYPDIYQTLLADWKDMGLAVDK